MTDSYSIGPPTPEAPQLATRREVLVGGGLLATALGSGLLARNAALADDTSAREVLIPDRVGRWSRSSDEGILIPRGEEDEQLYDQVVTGYYTSDSAPSVLLLVAYGSAQTGTTQLHRPEVCYPAAGFQIRELPDVSLQLPSRSIRARTMTAVATRRIEQILYWSRVGRDFPTSTNDQRWSVLRQTFQGVVPDGALVRMSIIDPDRLAAMTFLQGFAAALVAASSPDMRRLLTGSA
ncbi:exosortase C-terminal domain/associated protein EpsI [uncultured Sphingomonas sp.]|uniref:exosortase C-terminal domain/associated protein EpsI n=1 Tax=uncultured Sphingomonas sp. TaxID=158754 RepID=UPI0025F4BD71|nr:exosortase C-terminal domain/associated protein EpsI [uncultured Sphingomonas sp.]